MGAPRPFRIYCTGNDIRSVLEAAEEGGPLLYARTGLFDQESSAAAAAVGRDLPGLGCAATGDTVSEAAYLVLEAGHALNVRRVHAKSGKTLFAVDQLMNPSSVVLRPGGIYYDQCLIAGELTTVSDTAEALRLHHRFADAIRQSFRRIRSSWVGAEAYQLWENGFRLTHNVRASSAYDLRQK
jgi:hypothetical protein